MAINSESLRFSKDSILPLITASEWTYNNASTSEGNIIVNPGGSAKCIPTQTIINRVFQYFKVDITFDSSVITPESNFINSPYVFITEAYKNENNEISLNYNRSLGFNTFNKIDTASTYRDTTIFASSNREIGYYSFEIRNNSTGLLVIKQLGVYTSIDISGDQVGNVISSVNSGAELKEGKVYCTQDYSQLLGLGAILNGSEKEFKYQPIYAQGLLAQIKTNFGVNPTFTYIPENIDLST